MKNPSALVFGEFESDGKVVGMNTLREWNGIGTMSWGMMLAGVLGMAMVACAQTQPTTQASTQASGAGGVGGAVFPKLTGESEAGSSVGMEGVDLAVVPELPWVKKLVKAEEGGGGGGVLVISDKPEYFRTGNGVALDQKVPAGKVRVYVYHVPEPTGESRTISCVLENIGTGKATVQFTRAAFVKPGGDYHAMAKQVMADFFEGVVTTRLKALREIEPGGRVVLDPAMDAAVVKKDILVHGWYELVTDQPLRVVTFQRNVEDDSLKVIDWLPRLPKVLPGWHASGAGRGLFTEAEWEVTTKTAGVFDTSAGMVQLVVADGKNDQWMQGVDDISGESGEQNINKGNYGSLYHVKIPYTSSDGRGLAVVVVNARSDGKWCKSAGAVVRVNEGGGINGSGRVVRLPEKKLRYDGLPEAVVVGQYPALANGAKGMIDFTYTPPGASCLPQVFLLVPVEE